MKKSIFLMSMAIILVASSMVYASNIEKIGYVDLSRLFDEYHSTQEYDKTLEEMHNVFQESSKEKIEKIREKQGKLSLMKEDKKVALEEEIEELKADLLEFDRREKMDLNKDRNEKIREILLEIEKVVSDYAEKEKYTLILNDRVLIYSHQSIDITNAILEILNETEKK